MSGELGVYLADVLLKCRVVGLATPPGMPPLQEAQLSIVGSDSVLGIPVLQGDPGPAGAPAAPYKWQFPSLTSMAQLPTGLGDNATDRGKAWVINDGTGTADVAYWNGVEFKYHLNAFGPGLPGATPDVTATGEVVAEDEPFEVIRTGSDETPSLHFKIPGTPGPPGPAGPWPLFDATAARADGDVPVWDADAGKFVPAPPVMPRTVRYTLPEGSFTAYSGSASSQLLATMVLPSLPYDCHVEVDGHLRVGQQGIGSSARTGVQVRIGNQTTGQLVAKGLSVPSGPVIIGAHYSSQGSGQQSVASGPDSTVGILPAGSSGPAASLFVMGVRDQGSGGWFADAVDAQLSVKLIPTGD